MSFWGQVFDYKEMMYHKPLELPDGALQTLPVRFLSKRAGR